MNFISLGLGSGPALGKELSLGWIGGMLFPVFIYLIFEIFAAKWNKNRSGHLYIYTYMYIHTYIYIYVYTYKPPRDRKLDSHQNNGKFQITVYVQMMDRLNRLNSIEPRTPLSAGWWGHGHSE